MQIHNTRDTPCRLVRTPLGLNAAPRPHRGFDRASRDRERAYLSCVCTGLSCVCTGLASHPAHGSGLGWSGGLRLRLLDFGVRYWWAGDQTKWKASPRGRSGVSHVSRQQFTNDEAAAHPPPPRHLRLLRRRVRARAADGLADGAADPVRPACHPAADRGPTVCGAGSTHVHRAIDARTGGGAAAGGQLTVPLSPFHRTI